MGVTKVVEVQCDGVGCHQLVQYRGMEKDLAAEEWYAKNYRSTGATRYTPKQWFCSILCMDSRGPGSEGYKDE